MNTVLEKTNNKMIKKVISISSKRQITIPQNFFTAFGFDKEAECILQDDGLLIRPIHVANDNFSEEILKELISDGYNGEELLAEFRVRSKQLRSATENLIAEADLIAKNGGKPFNEDIFGI